MIPLFFLFQTSPLSVGRIAGPSKSAGPFTYPTLSVEPVLAPGYTRRGSTYENAVNATFLEPREREVQHSLAQTAQETSSNPPRTPGGASSSNETRTYFCSLIP